MIIFLIKIVLQYYHYYCNLQYYLMSKLVKFVIKLLHKYKV